VIASQLDLFPTLVDLLGFEDSFSALGDSLLRKKDGYAFVTAGSIVGLIGREGFLTHSLKNRLDSGAASGSPASRISTNWRRNCWPPIRWSTNY
jgi:hypothetical protein